MTGVHPLPTHGGVFLDDRGEERSLRASWHPEAGVDGVVVLSLWRAGACVATFRLRAEDVEDLVTALRASGGGTGVPEDAARHDRAC